MNLEQLLCRVFDEACDGLKRDLSAEEYERRRHDFFFHMLDWAYDLEQLSALFHNPGDFDADAASDRVIGFLYHVVPHLNAAARLLLDEIPDPFTAAAVTSAK